MFSVKFDMPSAASLKFNPHASYFTSEEKACIQAACCRTSEVSRTVLQALTRPMIDSKTSNLIAEWFGATLPKDVVVGARKMDTFIQGGGTVTFVDMRNKQERLIQNPNNPASDAIVPMTACDYAYVKLLPAFKSTGGAHVGSGMKLFLGERFFAPTKTLTDRTATIYHELSHKLLALEDIKYGTVNCRQLAKMSPAQALKNPDNWCYFATSFIYTWP